MSGLNGFSVEYDPAIGKIVLRTPSGYTWLTESEADTLAGWLIDPDHKEYDES